jgi:hypothetical protein
MDREYRTVTTAEDVDDEVLETAWSYVEGWYMDGPIDWEDVFYRMERNAPLNDGRYIDLGGDADSPAIRKIKRTVSKWKREANA